MIIGFQTPNRARYYKYQNNKTVFNPIRKIAFANEQAAFKDGVQKDWSNVDIIKKDMPKHAFKNFKVLE